jgi:Protein of unknown function (DUF1236)
MRAIVLSVVVFVALGSLGYAQNLKGVYGPPGSSTLGSSGLGSSGLGGGLGGSGLGGSGKSSSTLSAPDLGPVGGAIGLGGPRVTVPGTPVQGQTLPDDVTATPLPDRPGYGAVVVNGRRAIVDLRNNRIFQISD